MQKKMRLHRHRHRHRHRLSIFDTKNKIIYYMDMK